MVNDLDLTNPDFFVSGDPHSLWRELRAVDRVHWTERQNKRGFWSITNFDDAPDPNQPRMLYGFGQMMITTDPPRHGRIRQMLNRRFTPRALAPHEPHVRAITREIIDAVAEHGRCDLVVDVAAKLPTAVICEMLAVPRE